jgi:hypothetical protein
MKDVNIPLEARDWDFYQAFHTFCGFAADGFRRKGSWGVNPTPLVLFDTGELICTDAAPDPSKRGEYRSVGISLTTTKDERLWLPDGSPVTRAWLDDAGMQYLLVDRETKRAVRLDGTWRRAPGKNYYGKEEAGSPVTTGIPLRFQYNCRAYIPGPGLPPVSHEKLKVSIPIQKAGYTSDELEHIHMIVATGQAAMTLTDHEAVHRNASVGANPDVLLRCTTWQDCPEALLPALAQYGAGRVVREYDYLLTEQG